jgi:spore coat polysaccharide biosynthesis predicted glycosyltransferase SpsG
VGDGLSLIALVADAGPRDGLGHLSRSTALAVALMRSGAEVLGYGHRAGRPVSRGEIEWLPEPALESVAVPTEAEVVVIDSYTIELRRARKIASGRPLVLFDDSGSPPDAELVIAPLTAAEGRGSVLVGPEHCCLGPEYWDPPARSIAEDVRAVLVASGGGDPTGRVTETAGAVAEALPRAEVTVVIGPQSGAEAPGGVRELRAPESLREPLLESDLAVIAAGQTMLEALALGTPAAAGVVAENQRLGAERLTRLGAVEPVDPPTPSAMAVAAAALALDRNRRRALSEGAQRAIDGRGALRVAERVLALAAG